LSVAERKFFGEISALLEKTVVVVTSDGRRYTGTFAMEDLT